MSVSPPNASGLHDNLITVSSNEDFRNTWRLAVGGSYKPVADWLFRAGVGYDESPVRDANRTPRLPDGDRIGVALGTHYQAMKMLGVDVGYTHLFFVGNNRSNNVQVINGTQIATVNGSYSNHADIIGAQITWDIA